MTVRPTRRTALASSLLGLALVAPFVAAGSGTAAAAPSPISPTSWERTVLTTDVVDPTDLDVAKDGTVVIAERTGAIKLWKQDGTLVTAGKVPVSANGSFTDVGEDDLEEGGIHGLLLDRDFVKNRKVYVHRSVPGSVQGPKDEGVFRISSFTISKAGKLDLRSEKKLIDVPAEWEYCCHYGGDMEFMKDGTILLSVGDDTSPRDEGWNPRDKRKGREAFNAERTAQNKKDRRGKLLRFTTTGAVPKDNPHVKDKTYDPYVYAMGFRSDYRMGHDPVTGSTFVGNVGPDSRNPDPSRGPQGFDELEVVKKGGGSNHGWPRCIADNQAYMDYDYATGVSKGPLSCKGMTPAALYYDYTYSAEFPAVATGSRTQMAGPVYRSAGKGALALPSSFQGKLLHWDWSRGIMFATPVRKDGTLDTANLTPWSVGTPNTFLSAGGAVPVGGPSAPNEVVVGPDGALYVAEYGSGYYQNTNSAISRVTCAGCAPSSKDYMGSPVLETSAALAPPSGGASADGAGWLPEGVLRDAGEPVVATSLLLALSALLVAVVRRRPVLDLAGL